MKTTALDRFRQECRGWVKAWGNVHRTEVAPDDFLSRLEERIPAESLAQVGAAFINGWLENEPEPGRGYFVRESDRGGRRGGQYLVTSNAGSAWPCWELYLQLADYSRLRAAAVHTGFVIRLEDRQMDITVHAGSRLLLYVENKVHAADAVHLLAGMRKYGEAGVDLAAFDRGNDPLRKAKYIVSADTRPPFVALSAIGFEKVFRVDYGDQNRFVLTEVEMSLSAPLGEAAIDGQTPRREPADDLRLEMERVLGERLWISRGSGQTKYNFYASGVDGDAIVVGIYADGRVWTDNHGLGAIRAEAIAGGLAKLGIELDPTKRWAFWRCGDVAADLQDLDVSSIAEVLGGALVP